MNVIYPAQCSCGHLFLETYELKEPLESGAVGFCWCGFCRTRLDVFPVGHFKKPAIGVLIERDTR